LATSFSNAFVQGAEWVKDFVSELVKVDFEELTSQATGFFNNFGTAIDDATMRVKLFFAPFRTLFNGVTAGFATIGAVGAKFAEQQLDLFQRMAAAIPDMLGGDKIRARLEESQAGLRDMSAAMVEQIEQDGQDIRNAWDVTAQHSVDAEKQAQAERVAAAKSAADQQQMLNQAV